MCLQILSSNIKAMYLSTENSNYEIGTSGITSEVE